MFIFTRGEVEGGQMFFIFTFMGGGEENIVYFIFIYIGRVEREVASQSVFLYVRVNTVLMCSITAILEILLVSPY